MRHTLLWWDSEKSHTTLFVETFTSCRLCGLILENVDLTLENLDLAEVGVAQIDWLEKDDLPVLVPNFEVVDLTQRISHLLQGFEVGLRLVSLARRDQAGTQDLESHCHSAVIVDASFHQ